MVCIVGMNLVIILHSLTLSYGNMFDTHYLSVAVQFDKARLTSKAEGQHTNDSELLTASHKLS